MHEAPGGNVSTSTPTAFGGGDPQAAREVAHAANRVSLRISTPGLTKIRAIEYNRTRFRQQSLPPAAQAASSRCRNIASHQQPSSPTLAPGGAMYAQPPKGGIPVGVPAARQPVVGRRRPETLRSMVPGCSESNGTRAGRSQHQLRSSDDQSAARDPRPDVQRRGPTGEESPETTCYKP